MMGNNIKPEAPVQVQCLDIESLPVFYIIFNIPVESLPMQPSHHYDHLLEVGRDWCGPHGGLEIIQEGE